MKNALSIYPLLFAGILTFIVGSSTLYSSIVQVGFISSPPHLLLNLALIGYIISALVPALYIGAKG